MLTPRGTQPNFIEKGVELLTSKSTKKCVMVAPVAYGKSICIANIALRLGAGTIVLQPNQELLKQNYEKYTSYGYSATICCVSLKVKQIKKQAYTEINNKLVRCDEVSSMTYATIGSISKYAKLVKDLKIKYIIIDECHLNTGTDSVLRKFIKDTRIKNILGVTATAIVLRNSMSGATLRMMDRAYDNLFSTLAYVVQIQEVVNNKFWSKLRYIVRDVDLSKLQYNTSGSDFTAPSMSETYKLNDCEGRSAKAVKYLQDVKSRKSILIFVPSILDAVNLSRKIPNSKVISSKTPKNERVEIVENFKNLKIPVVINVEILTTGFDHPRLDAIILSRPTASIALYYQMIGRATRIHESKEDAIIIDFSGNVTKFGPIEYLNYEYIDGYGWGLFNEDELLTDFPLALSERPTKDTLREAATEEGQKTISEHGNTKIWFGKFKNKRVKDLPEDYIAFMLQNFEFHGKNMMSLKNSLQVYFKLI